MHLFYSPNIVGTEHLLSEEESFHCIKVLRLTKGAVVHLIDGEGGCFEAEILDVAKKGVKLKIVKTLASLGARNHYLHIAIAPTKNIDRLEWFLEKATEIGIDEISLVLCEHSERRVVKLDRLKKVLISAMKQSLRGYLPKLNDPIDFTDLVKQINQAHRFIAHCEADQVRTFISKSLPVHADALVLIGPEGDFSLNEIQLALQNGFKPISLGNSRLRTETAGLVACLEVNLLNRDE